MNEPQFEAHSVPEFLALATKFTKVHMVPEREKNWGPWFRGHTNAEWKLTPKLYRDKTPTRGIRVVEDEIRQEFVMRAPSLTRASPELLGMVLSNATFWGTH